MDLTIITVLKSGQHLTYSKAVADVRLLLESRGRRITSRRLRRAPPVPAVRGDRIGQLADNPALDHMAAGRREYEVEKFILIRGNLVTELDADSSPCPREFA